MGPHQTKVCAAKETISETKRQPTEWGKVFTNKTSSKELISKIIYKGLIKFDNKTAKNLVTEQSKELNGHFPKEVVQMAGRYMRRCPTSLPTREEQIQATGRYRLPLVRTAVVTETSNRACGRGRGAEGALTRCWWGRGLAQPLCRAVWGLLKT